MTIKRELPVSADLRFYEKKALAEGFLRVAGVDEAGRGPLAGPVISAAVILPSDFAVAEIDDSKKLSAKRRERLFDRITAEAVAVGIGVIGPDEIDRINILQAALRSMSIAVQALVSAPDHLLIDGKFTIAADISQEAIIRGDARSVSIAAASIIAKVTRDRLMVDYHGQYPEYGFSSHKGYPTKAHRAAVRKYGPSPIHRLTFKGVREFVSTSASLTDPLP